MSSRRREAPRAARRAEARRAESRGSETSIIDTTLAWTKTNAAVLWFSAAAATMCLLWLIVFSLRVPLWDADPLLIAKPVVMSRVFPGGVSSYMNTLLAISAISAAYLVCLWALRRGFRHDFAAAVAASAIAAAILVPMRPLASPDVTHLAADVRTLWLHGRFPALGPNAPAHINDPIANQVAVYRNGPSGYGPVAYAIGGIALPFAGNGLAANVAGQKAVAGACLVAAAFLVGLAAKRLGQNAAAVAGFIGLNPLLLFEFAGDGHDDSIMIAIGALAVMFIFEERWRDRLIGAGIGMLSVLTKFTLILAAPVVVAAWFPRYRRWLALVVTRITGSRAPPSRRRPWTSSTARARPER